MKGCWSCLPEKLVHQVLFATKMCAMCTSVCKLIFFFFLVMNRTCVGKVGGQKFTSSWGIIMKNECIQTGVVKHLTYGSAVLESNLVKILYHLQNASFILKINMECTIYYFIYITENLFLLSLPVNLVVIQKTWCPLWWWW